MKRWLYAGIAALCLLATAALGQQFVLIQRSDLAGSCQVDCDPPAGGGGGAAEGTIYDRAYDGDSRAGAAGANETD